MAEHVFKLRWVGLPEAVHEFEKELNSIARESATVVKNTAETIARKAASALRRGQFKAFRTGELSRAHKVVMVRSDHKGSLSEVHNTKPYSYYIHNGTKKGIKGRPWLRHVTNKEANSFVKKMVAVVERKKTVQLEASPSLSFNSPK